MPKKIKYQSRNFNNRIPGSKIVTSQSKLKGEFILKADIFCIICLTVIYLFLSPAGLNWDHIELLDGYGRDSDPGGVAEAVRYVHAFGENWNKGYKEYPQGYGYLLALFYKSALSVSSLLGNLPAYEVNISYDRLYGRLPLPSVHISTQEGRLFFAMGARMVSSLFGWMTVLLTYFIGKNFFSNRKIGFISGIFLMSTYSFIAYSQVTKYPAMAFFFFLLSFYASLKLLNEPYLKHYIINALYAGIATSMIYYNGLTLLVLLGAHILSLGHLSIKKVLFNKKLLIALLTYGITFLILNPRILTHGFMLLAQIILWAGLFTSGTRSHIFLFTTYDGPWAFLLRIKDTIGVILLSAMYLGMIISLVNKNKKREELLFIFVGIIFSLLSIGAMQNYVVATAYPILLILFTKYFVKGFEMISFKRQWGAALRFFILFILVISIALPGFCKIISQNLVNVQLSTIIQARIWIQKNLPGDIKVISEDIYVMSKNQGQHFIVSGDRVHYDNISHDLRDLLAKNGVGLFEAQYAITGSRKFSKLISDKHIQKYPALQNIHSPQGVAHGLKEAYNTYLKLLEKYAILIKEFPEGKWVENQGWAWGEPFLGVSFGEWIPFFSDPALRRHGPPVKIYRLTPLFWNALKEALITPVVYTKCDENINTMESGGLIGKTIKYHSKTRQLNIDLCWDSKNKEIMREVDFIVMPNRYEFKNNNYYINKYIKNFLGNEISLNDHYKEFFRPKKEHFTTRYKLKIPLNMLSGKYAVSVKYKRGNAKGLKLYTFIL